MSSRTRPSRGGRERGLSPRTRPRARAGDEGERGPPLRTSSRGIRRPRGGGRAGNPRGLRNGRGGRSCARGRRDVRGGSGVCRLGWGHAMVAKVVSPVDVTPLGQPREMSLRTRPRLDGSSRGCCRGQATVQPQRMSPPGRGRSGGRGGCRCGRGRRGRGCAETVAADKATR